ncbi:hypothetical protein MUY27_02620 [Mucilaginibacter sp. RS28]|uniref:Uncharacterized protein n=1 Tax=Mucilaginibacter straminoryzae TaxID=2932774 RepID=A0A9X1X266_9SPHI|nr:hypothetical protein [Mucilaginibacter straminoryzae]MCJ8208585.1 hypothetical protein [Mucilaginibacter straminoryzae]
MKTPRKFIIPVLLLAIVVLSVILVFKINCRSPYVIQGAIPADTINHRLTGYNVVQAQKNTFDSLSRTFFKAVPYKGAVINSADLLLALGLNDDYLYRYIQCEKIKFKTQLGLVNDSIKVYVHPIDISSPKNPKDLFFNKEGNLCYKDGTLWQNPCKACFFCSIFSSSNPPARKLNDDPDGVYYIDLNNPCPPCSTED